MARRSDDLAGEESWEEVREEVESFLTREEEEERRTVEEEERREEEEASLKGVPLPKGEEALEEDEEEGREEGREEVKEGERAREEEG